jgi:Arc/MetJ-type ribon-helix-helix transcriptional regulator
MRRINPTAGTDESARIVVTLPRSLLHELEELADRMGYGRDEVIRLALDRLVDKERPLNTLRDQINVGYEDYPDADEQAWNAAMRDRFRAILESDDSAGQPG